METCDKKRILITDDDEQICEMFQFALSVDFPNCEIDIANDGLSGFQLFQEKHHAVLIMDLHMPIMDGLDAYNEIYDMCDLEELEKPTVIFCTAYDPPHAVSDIVRSNPEKSSILRKPVNTEFLIDKVKNALES